jgi:hypothetical protein
MKTILQTNTIVLKSLSVATLVALIGVLSSNLTAQISLPTKSVSIFKNGTCLFTKEGTVSVKDGVVRLPIPNAINSTYWLTTPNEKLIKSVSFKTENQKVQHDVASIVELLEANIGKRINFEIVRYNTASAVQSSGTSSSAFPQSGTLLGVNKLTGMFRIADKTGTHYFATTELQSGNFSIEDAKDTRTVDSSTRYAIVTPTKSVSEMTLQEISMQNGVQWIPSYSIKLVSGKEARIEMKALIENFSKEQITDADAELIVGVPQLASGQTLDPAISQFYTSFGYGANTNYTTQMLAGNNSSNFIIRGSRASDTQIRIDGGDISNNDFLYSADAEQSNGIYIYKIGSISIDTSSKKSFPVFASNIEYKDIHECEIPDVTNYEVNRMMDAREDMFDVFHSIELHNTTSYPLTTAGTIVTDEKSRFLAQNVLKYIPKGGRGIIRLQKAINVSLKCSEEELQRTDNAKRVSKQNYGRTRIKGTIGIENFEDKDITLTVKKNMNGTVVLQGSGKVVKRNEHRGINPQSELTYEVDLRKGAKVELQYEYETYFSQ